VHTSDIGARVRRLKRPRLIGNIAMILVTVAFSYFAIRGVDLHDMWSALRHCDYWWLIPTLITFAVAVGLRALRWRSLFAPGRRPGRAVVGNAMLIGYLYNSILPARAGEAARVVVLGQRSEAPPTEIVGTVALERLYDVVAVLLIFFVSEPWLPHVSWFGTAAVAAAVLALAIAAAAVVLAVYEDRPLRLLLRPLGRLPHFSGERLERTIEELAHGLSGLRHHGVAFEALLWTLTAWMVSALSAWLLTLAFPLHLPFTSGIMVVVAVGLAMILPAAPAAVGVFEAAALIALHAYGVSHTDALPYALVLHLTNFIPFVLAGALVLQHNARHPVRRRVVEETPEVALAAHATPVGP
jgi:hypothetical protein